MCMFVRYLIYYGNEALGQLSTFENEYQIELSAPPVSVPDFLPDLLFSPTVQNHM